MGARFSVSGFAELRKGFNQISLAGQNKRLESAVLAGSRVVRDRARQIAEAKDIRQTGATIENIVHKRVRENDPFSAEAHVAVRHGVQTKRAKAKARRALAKGDKEGAAKALENVNDPYYWRFHERGTSKMGARPFIRPGLEESKGQAIDAMRKSLKSGIAAAARQAGVKYVG